MPGFSRFFTVCIILILSRTPTWSGGKSDPGFIKMIVVRHAERDAGEDPPLNPAGIKRAELLSATLADQDIHSIYTVNLKRNIQTAQPLAERLGLQVQTLPDSLIRETQSVPTYFMEKIFPEHRGKVLLFIGNQRAPGPDRYGNIVELFRQLAKLPPPLTRYCDIHIIHIHQDGSLRHTHTTYGSDN